MRAADENPVRRPDRRDADEAAFAALRAVEVIGRPLADKDFIEGLERVLGRPVARRAPGAQTKGRPGGAGRIVPGVKWGNIGAVTEFTPKARAAEE